MTNETAGRRVIGIGKNQQEAGELAARSEQRPEVLQVQDAIEGLISGQYHCDPLLRGGDDPFSGSSTEHKGSRTYIENARLLQGAFGRQYTGKLTPENGLNAAVEIYLDLFRVQTLREGKIEPLAPQTLDHLPRLLDDMGAEPAVVAQTEQQIERLHELRQPRPAIEVTIQGQLPSKAHRGHWWNRRHSA